MFDDDEAFVLGSSNGLVVYKEKEVADDGGCRLCATNPVTHASEFIPCPTNIVEPRNVGIAMSFEDGHNDQVDYLLICISPTPEWGTCMEWNVCSSKRKSWATSKEIDAGGRDVKYERPVIKNKTMHLVSSCASCFKLDPFILAIDIDDHDAISSKKLPRPLPPPHAGDQSSLSRREKYDIEIAEWGEHGSSLCLILWCSSTSTFRIWILEDQSKWTWSIEVTTESMGLEKDAVIEKSTTIDGDSLMFSVETAMHVYGLKDGIRRELPENLPPCRPTFFPYSNTLQPPSSILGFVITVLVRKFLPIFR